MTYEQKFQALGNLPPEPSVPAGCNFVMYKQVGNLLILSGYGPFIGEKIAPASTGKLGEERTVDEGYQAARLTAINLLLIAQQSIQTLNNVIEIVSVEGMVNCTPQFIQQSQVINGCSDLLVEIFGNNGRHTRSAIGVSSLAFDICVEISLSLLVR